MHGIHNSWLYLVMNERRIRIFAGKRGGGGEGSEGDEKRMSRMFKTVRNLRTS